MATLAAARAMKPIVVALAVALLLVGAVGVIALRTLGPGSGGLGGTVDRLEDWIGSQIVAITNSYLVPQIAFESLDYQAPGAVRLTGVTLTAPDGTRVLELPGMMVSLAEVPRIGRPIVIERIELERPTIRLIRETRPDGSAGLRGLSPIVRATPGADETVPESLRLSNVLRLRQVEVTQGALLYDQSDGSPPMSISGLTTTIISAPDANEPGWYSLDIDSAAGPLARLSLVGLLSLDSLEARIDRLQLDADLSDQGRAVLPPPIQELLITHEVRGALNLVASGSLSLTDPLAGALQATASLRDAHLAAGKYQVPVSILTADATLGSGIATLTSLRAELLGGVVTSHGDIELAAESKPAHLFWTIEGVELQDLLRAGSAEGGPPKLAGALQGAGSATTDLADPRGSLAGEGEAHVRNGRLTSLPVLTALAEIMRIGTMQLASGERNDKADAEFNLGPQGVLVTSSEVRTQFLAARGTGTIAFDGALDLSLNAGPIEKVQSLLGGVGDVLGAVTDRLVKYRVRGKIGSPQVTVAPLGVGG